MPCCIRPQANNPGRLWMWTIGRTPSLGMIFTRIKKRRISFPRLSDCSSFLDEIWCEVAEYDDQQRTIRYTHPETQPDDALHGINYAAMANFYTRVWDFDRVIMYVTGMDRDLAGDAILESLVQIVDKDFIHCYFCTHLCNSMS